MENLRHLVLAAAALTAALPLRAFRYSQEITVTRPGLQRARLPFESMEKASSREEMRLFTPDGIDIPLVVRGLELSGARFPQKVAADKRYVIESGRSFLTFSAEPDEDGFEITSQGKTTKGVVVERSRDGVTWTHAFKTTFDYRMVVGFPPGARAYFRVIFLDADTPPLSNVNVRLRRARTGEPLEMMDVPFKALPGSPNGVRLEMTPPIRHSVSDGIEVETPDLERANLGRAKSGSRDMSGGGEWIQPEGNYSHAEYFIPAAGPTRILAGWGGYGHDNTIWLGLIPGPENMRVTAVRARVRPYFLVFDAAAPGTYVLRFGTDRPGTDQVLVYGERQKDLTRRAGEATHFVEAKAGPVQTHGSVLAAQQSTGWDPLPSMIDGGAFPSRIPAVVEKEGFQTAGVPAEVWAVSPDPALWRMSRDGRELPFQVKRARAFSPVKEEKVATTDGKSRYKLTGRFKGLPRLSLRIDSLGRYGPRAARILGEKGEVMAQFTLAPNQRALSEMAKDPRVPFPSWENFPLKTEASGDILFLEIDDAGQPPVEIDRMSAEYWGAEVVFRAKPADNTQFLYGNAAAKDPGYAVRKSSGVTVSEFRAALSVAEAPPPLTTSAGDAPPLNIANVEVPQHLIPKTPPATATAPAAGGSSRLIFWVIFAILAGFVGGISFSRRR